MQYKGYYNSPLGRMFFTADDKGLISLRFEGLMEASGTSDQKKQNEPEIPLFADVKKWLDIYFQGERTEFKVPLHILGSDFQERVWKILLNIPYGQTITYGEIAEKIAEEKKIPRMSAQAVGGAVGNNRILIMIPCHRVIGKNGSLTGYSGGITRKVELLKLEGIDTN